MSQISVINKQVDFVQNLEIVYNSATTIYIEAGSCRDKNNNSTINLKEKVVVQTDIVGVNGYDGKFPYTYDRAVLAVYIIGNSFDTSMVGGLLSLDPETPLLPNNYNIYRRIGWINVIANTIIFQFAQSGEGLTRYYYHTIPSAGDDLIGLPYQLFPTPDTIVSRSIPKIDTIANITIVTDPNPTSRLRFKLPDASFEQVSFSNVNRTNIVNQNVPLKLLNNNAVCFASNSGGLAFAANCSSAGYVDYL